MFTRNNQRTDRIYVLPNKGGCFVSPDGEGRVYFDTVPEADEQYGPMRKVFLSKYPED